MNFITLKQVQQQYPQWRFRCTPIAMQSGKMLGGLKLMSGPFSIGRRYLFEATQVVKVYGGRGNGTRLPDRLLTLAVLAPTVTQAFEELLSQLQSLEKKASEG